MGTLQEKEAMRDLPFREDGTIGLNEMMRRELERMANRIMGWQADELCGEGNRRNGYRERKLVTALGEITMGIPKLREGSYFPDELVRPYSRVDRAKAADALGLGSLSPSRISRMTAGLDEEVAALNARRLDGMPFPYPWLDATYLSCRDGGRVQSKGVVTAIACGEDGSLRFAGPGIVDTESAVSWKAFLRGLRKRGVAGVRCVVSDGHGGLVQAAAEVFRGAAEDRRDRAARRGAPGGRGGRRAGLPRLPLRAPYQAARQRRPGARRRGDRAPDQGGGRVPVRRVDDAPRGLGARGRQRGVARDELHRRRLPQGCLQVGARHRPHPGGDRREGEDVRRGGHRGEAGEGRLMPVQNGTGSG